LLTLIRAAKQNAKDDAIRLKLAELLIKEANPRGELVRIQCELARLSKDDPRSAVLVEHQNELLKRHEKEWLGPLFHIAESCLFSRGMLDVSFKAGKFFSKSVQDWAVSEASAWSEALTIYDIKATEVARFARMPFLANLTALHLGGKLGSKGLKVLLDSPHLAH